MTQVAVITGASAGIGRATACEFARHGCKVARSRLRRIATTSVRTAGCPRGSWSELRFRQTIANTPAPALGEENQGWLAAGAVLALGSSLGPSHE